MRFNRNILVLVNPKKNEQVALDKAIRMAEHWKSTITALVRKKHAEVPGLLEVLDGKLSVASAKGIEVSVKISDDRNWFRAIRRTLAEQEYGLVVKEPHAPSLADHVFPPDDWKLLRSTLHPVLLTRADTDWRGGPVMVCVNGNPSDDDHTRLNETIIQAGKLIATLGEGELHLFSASPSEMLDVAANQPSHTALTREYHANCRALIASERIPDERIHIEPGPAELLIPDFAQRVGAKLVIMGTVARSGLKGVLLGNTAEQVAARLNTDLLVLPPMA